MDIERQKKELLEMLTNIALDYTVLVLGNTEDEFGEERFKIGISMADALYAGIDKGTNMVNRNRN